MTHGNENWADGYRVGREGLDPDVCSLPAWGHDWWSWVMGYRAGFLKLTGLTPEAAGC